MTRDELVAEIARTDPLGVHRLMELIDAYADQVYDDGVSDGYASGSRAEWQ